MRMAAAGKVILSMSEKGNDSTSMPTKEITVMPSR